MSSERRGAAVGRYCHGCNQVYSPHQAVHSGDPIAGRDHVASTCPYEGWKFEAGATWWEPAVEVLPPPMAEPPAAVAATAPLVAAPAGPPKA